MIGDNQSEIQFIDENESLKDLESLKAEKIAKEKKELLSNVISGNINNLRERVAFILNRYSSSRNSDIELAWNYWLTFEKNKFNGISISKNELNRLSRMSSLIRTRAKIQNEYKLFQADDKVKKYRGILEKEKRSQAIEEKPPDIPTYSVYIDETGKNDNFLSVGSLWIIEVGFSEIYTHKDLTKWKKANSIDYEFHFSQVKNHKLSKYKEFFSKFLSLNPSIGFKIIMVKNDGFKHTKDPIVDLTFHLIHKGVIHEDTTGRAPLPRNLRVWIDDEEKGSDKLKLENIQERLSSQNIENLYLENFESVSSTNNFYIQAVDLFTASVNRKINYPEGKNIKDELANYILDILEFDITNFNVDNIKIDNSKVFHLK